MTDPYSSYPPPPYQAPRKLVRSRSNRFVGGVCGGVAEYVNMDPTLVRILTIVLSLFTGVPIVLYLIALFVLPEEDTSGAQNPPPVNGPQSHQWSYGSYPQSGESQVPQQPTYAPSHRPQPDPQDRAVWGATGAPWEQAGSAGSGTSSPNSADPDSTDPHQPGGLR